MALSLSDDEADDCDNLNRHHDIVDYLLHPINPVLLPVL